MLRKCYVFKYIGLVKCKRSRWILKCHLCHWTIIQSNISRTLFADLLDFLLWIEDSMEMSQIFVNLHKSGQKNTDIWKHCLTLLTKSNNTTDLVSSESFHSVQAWRTAVWQCWHQDDSDKGVRTCRWSFAFAYDSCLPEGYNQVNTWC